MLMLGTPVLPAAAACRCIGVSSTHSASIQVLRSYGGLAIAKLGWVGGVLCKPCRSKLLR